MTGQRGGRAGVRVDPNAVSTIGTGVRTIVQRMVGSAGGEE
jgi:hypothetical protein